MADYYATCEASEIEAEERRSFLSASFLFFFCFLMNIVYCETRRPSPERIKESRWANEKKKKMRMRGHGQDSFARLCHATYCSFLSRKNGTKTKAKARDGLCVFFGCLHPQIPAPFSYKFSLCCSILHNKKRKLLTTHKTKHSHWSSFYGDHHK